MRQIAGKSKQKSTPYAVSGTQRRATERERERDRERGRDREGGGGEERTLASRHFFFHFPTTH